MQIFAGFPTGETISNDHEANTQMSSTSAASSFMKSTKNVKFFDVIMTMEPAADSPWSFEAGTGLFFHSQAECERAKIGPPKHFSAAEKTQWRLDDAAAEDVAAEFRMLRPPKQSRKAIAEKCGFPVRTATLAKLQQTSALKIQSAWQQKVSGIRPRSVELRDSRLQIQEVTHDLQPAPSCVEDVADGQQALRRDGAGDDKDIGDLWWDLGKWLSILAMCSGRRSRA